MGCTGLYLLSYGLVLTTSARFPNFADMVLAVLNLAGLATAIYGALWASKAISPVAAPLVGLLLLALSIVFPWLVPFFMEPNSLGWSSAALHTAQVITVGSAYLGGIALLLAGTWRMRRVQVGQG